MDVAVLIAAWEAAMLLFHNNGCDDDSGGASVGEGPREGGLDTGGGGYVLWYRDRGALEAA